MCRVDYDDESPTVHSSKIVTARKPHRCEECGRTILPGEQYKYVFMVYDGLAGSFHTCEHCQVICGWLVNNCDGYLIGYAVSDFAEHAFEYPDLAAAIDPIVEAARSQWRDLLDTGLVPVPKMPPSISVAEAAE